MLDTLDVTLLSGNNECMVSTVVLCSLFNVRFWDYLATHQNCLVWKVFTRRKFEMLKGEKFDFTTVFIFFASAHTVPTSIKGAILHREKMLIFF